MELIGWIGSIMLSICGLPQAVQSFKDKHSNGISWGFILLWWFGEIFAVIYVISKREYPIIFNCALNTVIVSIIFYYKYKTYRFRYNYIKCLVNLKHLREMNTKDIINILLSKVKFIFTILYIFKAKNSI
jgi:uncharacterized protein with PQ loop repeat